MSGTKLMRLNNDHIAVAKERLRLLCDLKSCPITHAVLVPTESIYLIGGVRQPTTVLMHKYKTSSGDISLKATNLTRLRRDVSLNYGRRAREIPNTPRGWDHLDLFGLQPAYSADNLNAILDRVRATLGMDAYLRPATFAEMVFMGVYAYFKSLSSSGKDIRLFDTEDSIRQYLSTVKDGGSNPPNDSKPMPKPTPTPKKVSSVGHITISYT